MFLADLPNRERLMPERAPKDHEERKRVKHLVEAITASAECTTLPWSSEEEDDEGYYRHAVFSQTDSFCRMSRKHVPIFLLSLWKNVTANA